MESDDEMISVEEQVDDQSEDLIFHSLPCKGEYNENPSASEEEEEQEQEEDDSSDSSKSGRRRSSRFRNTPSKRRSSIDDEDYSYAAKSKRKRAKKEKEYEVEKILDKEPKEGVAVEYLVRWKGYTKEHDMWIPAKELSKCKALIRAFENDSKKTRKENKNATLWRHNELAIKAMEQVTEVRNLYLRFHAPDISAADTIDLVDNRCEELSKAEGKRWKQLDEEFEAKFFDSTPDFLEGGELRPYQLEGINWLIRMHELGVPRILADEMGLGKTVQSITLLSYLHYVKKEDGPYLVLAPLSVLQEWMKEFQRWSPQLRIVMFHGNKKHRAKLIAEDLLLDKFDVCVTNYESLVTEKYAFRKFVWKYLIIDEAHRIKNEKAYLSTCLRVVRSQHFLLLTGTPLQNNLHELWSLLNFMLPDVFESSKQFDAAFDLGKQSYNQDLLHKAGKLLEPFMLRRMKKDVPTLSIPDRTEMKIYLPLSPLQTDLYKSVISQNFEFLQGLEKKVRGIDLKQLLNMLMQLRKTCDHPYLFDIEPEPFEMGDHIVAASSKLQFLDKLLPKLQANSSRVLLFSQFTRMLDIVEDFVNLRGFTYVRLDGSTHQVERDFNINRFTKDPSIFIFLISTKAGGLGLNLAAADTVVLYDSDWNPQVDLQALSRSHRIGQTKDVKVYRLLCQDTIEERVIQRAEQKMYLDAVVMSGGKQGLNLEDDTKGLTAAEVFSIVKFGANAIFNSRGTDLTDEDIDRILLKANEDNEKQTRVKSETSEESCDKLKQGCELDLLKYQVENTKLYPARRFQGVDYKSPKQRGFNLISTENIVTGFLRSSNNNNKDPVKSPIPKSPPPARKRPWEHEDFCLLCLKKKTDMKCSWCPKVYHKACVLSQFGEDPAETASQGAWTCTWHQCQGCQKGMGILGFLFRCDCCPLAYCMECLPKDIDVVGKISQNCYTGYSSTNSLFIVCPNCKQSQRPQKLGMVICSIVDSPSAAREGIEKSKGQGRRRDINHGDDDEDLIQLPKHEDSKEDQE